MVASKSVLSAPSLGVVVVTAVCFLTIPAINAAEYERLWSLFPEQEVKQQPQFELPEPRRKPIAAPTTDDFCGTAEQLSESLIPLAEMSLDVNPSGTTPPNCFQSHFDNEQFTGLLPCGPHSYNFHWAPSDIFCDPLYFEEVPLERYGQGYAPWIQPIVSGVRFFKNVAILPYKIGLDRPLARVHPLGYVRPGNCAPSVKEHLPWSWPGAILQTGAVLGGGLLFP